MANKINIKIEAQDNASKPIRGVADELENGSNKAGKFSGSLSALGGTLARTAVAAGVVAAVAGTAGVTIGFGFNSAVEQAETKLMAFTQSQEKTAETMKWVKDEAAKTQFGFTDMAEAAANLTPVAKQSGVELQALIKQAEILAATNPAEGLTGATFALREAMSGDWTSIIERFNLPRKRINELKEQGVPAMEIISRTMGEMGINYDLVAKQGQTVSARFDQVKDKLTMMAGEATKPIFDRVSRELDRLGSFDYAALGANLSGTVSSAIEQFDKFLPRIIDTGKQVGDYLGPKFGALGDALQTKVIPVVSDLWTNYLAPFAVFAGTALVGAIGLVTDTLTGTINAISWLVTQIQNGNPWVIGLTTSFVALGTALALGKAFGAVSTALTVLQVTTIPAVIAKVGALSALVATPMIMPAIAIAAALGAIATVWSKYNEMQSAIEGAKQAQAQSAQAGADLRKVADRKFSEGKIDKKERDRLYSVSWKASGTNYASPGVTWVGEHGPEPVIMPAGAQVVPHYRARNGDMPTSGGGHTVIIENYNSYNERDDQRFFRDIGFALELAS